MDTTQTVFAAFVITALVATAIYFLVIQRKKAGAGNKHPHFEPRAKRDRELGNDGRNYPNATQVNGGYNGGGGLPG
ncbi:hypothetical protein [Arthrobacter sp. NicSoilC12]|uniref:hypothetical protein n=1 Tax=Arthrobacter sp. NicSoilC12 TaxID=2831001 RepID=UPI001CC7C827|nr:hypothetical protein [Arthrobacter sp. NicSoilC12]GIU57757.1 hypothetical protein NicSoilC12_35060 [Arthrobacter sp. NicSoilC12]